MLSFVLYVRYVLVSFGSFYVINKNVLNHKPSEQPFDRFLKS